MELEERKNSAWREPGTWDWEEFIIMKKIDEAMNVEWDSGRGYCSDDVKPCGMKFGKERWKENRR